ncbi:phage portal protein [Glycomyces arizonensis]|uniref:phage portal protein n=1 Tax=Glycomyces arizonensis TaxID=256035 RepID=UPI00040B9329|nr:phage portal protein [Glycomyces arizonensis]
MPLPTGGTEETWPPEHLKPVYAKYAEWSAWHSGDPEQLAAVYEGAATPQTRRTFLGRLVTTVRRWFWGNTESESRPRQRVHVPLAGDVAATSADLLFSDPPKIRIHVDEPGTEPDEGEQGEGGDVDDEAEDPTQTRLDELIDDGAIAAFLEAAEIAAAMGGVYLRVVWDKEVEPDRPWIAAVHPDAAVPEWRYGRLWAVTFWRSILVNGNRVVRHLERHEVDRTGETPRGIIRHGVYDGGLASLGNLAALTDFPETSGLASSIDWGDEIDTGHAGLTAVYVPNMRPNRIWRGLPDASALGASDYSGTEDLLDFLDLTYSSWARDVELGKARLIVPADYLQNLGAGQGAAFDLDRELYEGVNAGGDDEKTDITQVQFPIRWAEHQETVNQIKRDIVASAGYSAATFGLTDGGQAVTATEVNADERKSHVTTGRKARYWGVELPAILEALLAVDAHQFNTKIVPQRPLIEWPPAVAVDPETESRTLANLESARAISLEEKARRLHPDWKAKQVEAEVERLKEEYAIGQAEDPSEFTGGSFGDEQPEDTEADEEQASEPEATEAA